MKIQYYIYIALVVAFGVALFLIGRSTKENTVISPNIVEIQRLKDSVNTLTEQRRELALIDSLKTIKIDSLSQIILSIKPEEHKANIDSIISKDSSQSIVQFRLQLNNLGADTSELPYASYYELGFAAKFLSEIPGLKLKVKKYEELVGLYKNTIKVKNDMIDNLTNENNVKSLMQLDTEKNMNLFKTAYDNTQKFWYDRFVVIIGPAVSYTGTNFYPTISLTLGVKLWGTK